MKELLSSPVRMFSLFVVIFLDFLGEIIHVVLCMLFSDFTKGVFISLCSRHAFNNLFLLPKAEDVY